MWQYSRLGDFLRLLRNPPYLAKISALAGNNPLLEQECPGIPSNIPDKFNCSRPGIEDLPGYLPTQIPENTATQAAAVLASNRLHVTD